MVRFELDVVNTTLGAFAQILVKAGYQVVLKISNEEDGDLLLDVIAGPSQSTR
ncbi:hypothetical protein ACFOWE_31120 [Planomonospora corallina]|uniref:Uncharacterized protein n=1 Tax=Planomonospora corallina TaxID=1806052 RepID=A0ABV8IFV1_9ACTN